MDPISRETCTFSAPYGCTEAPADIEDPEREALADMTTTWHNYFQTRTWYLHSSKISHADVNIEYRTSHGRIATNIDMWRDIVKGIGIGQVDPTFIPAEDPSLLVSQ